MKSCMYINNSLFTAFKCYKHINIILDTFQEYIQRWIDYLYYDKTFYKQFLCINTKLKYLLFVDTGDKQQQPAGSADGTKRRDRITALFIKLMTRLFRQRPFQRLLCGSNATCLANLNTPAY